MDLDLFFVLEKVLQKQLRIVHFHGHQECAEALPPSKFEEFHAKLTVSSVDSPTVELVEA
jgi:hypothetical protein